MPLLAWLSLMFATAVATLPAAAAQSDPDWPCIQRLVPEIAPGMIWAGPPIDAVDRSENAPVIEEIASELAARRVPIEDARRRIDEFAEALDPADRNEELTRLFAETLEIINRDRVSIIDGIKRFARQQHGLSEKIERIDAALREVKKGEGSSEQQARQDTLEEERDWSVRIFDEREDSLTYLCEQPVLLEQRAFALAREIAGHLN